MVECAAFSCYLELGARTAQASLARLLQLHQMLSAPTEVCARFSILRVQHQLQQERIDQAAQGLLEFEKHYGIEISSDIQADYLWISRWGRIEEGIRFIRQWKGSL